MRSFLYTAVATLALSSLGLARPMPKPESGEVHVDADGNVWVEEIVYKTITVQPQAATPTPTPTPSPVQPSSSAPPPPPPPPPTSSAKPEPKPAVKQVNNNIDKPTTPPATSTSQGGLLSGILPSGLVPKPNSGSSSGGNWIVTEGGSPDQITFHITNMHDQEISVKYDQNPGSPKAVGSGNTIAPGEKITVTAANGYAGNMFIAESRFGHSNADSLIEGSFMPWGGGAPFADFDVSYVSGFTVPIMCKMEGHSSGCSKDLYALNSCSDQVNPGACGNPGRVSYEVNAFFAPCENLAYVYPSNDAKAKVNINLQSQTNIISCCIGTQC